MSPTQYQLWYNQIFAGVLISKEKQNMGHTLKYAKCLSFYAPIRSYLRVPGEAKTLEYQIFYFCKKCHIPKCSSWSVIFETVSINWYNWWQTKKHKMASKIVAKVENSVYSKYESQSLPIAIKPIVFRFSMQWRWFLITYIHFSSYLSLHGWLNGHFCSRWSDSKGINGIK